MSAERTLTVKILGDSSGGQKALNEVGKSSEGLGGTLTKVGIGLAATVAAAGASAVAFAKVSVDKFKAVGGEVSQLQRLTGGSAESMSRLRFAAQQTGVGTDALGAGLQKLSVNIQKNSKGFQALGINFKDAHGKALPLDLALGNVSEKFKNMPNGVEKNALAVQLFGKAGTDLIPILNKGKEGLGELSKEADKYGLTLSQSNVDALKKNAAAHKELNAAVEGLQIQLGAVLLPVLADVFSTFSSKVLPVILEVTTFVRSQFGPIITTVFGEVGSALGAAAGWVRAFWGDFQEGANTSSAGLEPVKDIHSVFLDLGVVFGTVKDAMAGLVSYIRSDAVPWIVDQWKQHGPEVQAFWDGLKQKLQEARDAIESDVVPKLQTLWQTLKNDVLPAVQSVAKGFADELGPALKDFSTSNAVPTILAVAGLAEALNTLSDFAPLAGIFESLGMTIGGVAIPGVVVAGVVIALGAAAIYAYTHFQIVRDVIGAVGDFLTGTVWPKIQEFGGFVMDKFRELQAFTDEIWPQVQEAISHVINVIKDIIFVVVAAIVIFWREFGDNILAFAKISWDLIKAYVEFAIRYIGDVIRFWLAIINGDWGKAWAAAKDALAAIWDFIKAIIKAAIDVIWNVIKAGLGLIQDIWSGIWNWIKDRVSDAWKDVKDKVRSGLDDVEGAIKGMATRVKNAASGMWDGISNAFKAAINFMIRGWNNLDFKVPGFDIGPVHFDGFNLGVPDIPFLAKGGVVKARPGGTLAVLGEAGRDEAVVPLDHSGKLGGVTNNYEYNYNVTASGAYAEPITEQGLALLLRRTEMNQASYYANA